MTPARALPPERRAGSRFRGTGQGADHVRRRRGYAGPGGIMGAGGSARRRGAHRALLVAATAAAVLSMPAVAAAVVDLEAGGPAALPDVDTRPVVAPTDAQRDAARATGAEVEWGRSGTPSSVFRTSGPVASGVPGGDATSAARTWLSDNRTLFRLTSLDDLDVVSSGPLA